MDQTRSKKISGYVTFHQKLKRAKSVRYFWRTPNEHNLISNFILAGRVMNASHVPSPYSTDDVLFQRGVFSMPGYYYENDRVYHVDDPSTAINCTSRSFNSKNNSVFNLTTTSADNSTFTCLLLWLTVNASDEVEVKCMPHNGKFEYHYAFMKQCMTWLLVNHAAVWCGWRLICMQNVCNRFRKFALRITHDISRKVQRWQNDFWCEK